MVAILKKDNIIRPNQAFRERHGLDDDLFITLGKRSGKGIGQYSLLIVPFNPIWQSDYGESEKEHTFAMTLIRMPKQMAKTPTQKGTPKYAEIDFARTKRIEVSNADITVSTNIDLIGHVQPHDRERLQETAKPYMENAEAAFYSKSPKKITAKPPDESNKKEEQTTPPPAPEKRKPTMQDLKPEHPSRAPSSFTARQRDPKTLDKIKMQTSKQQRKTGNKPKIFDVTVADAAELGLLKPEDSKADLGKIIVPFLKDDEITLRQLFRARERGNMESLMPELPSGVANQLDEALPDIMRNFKKAAPDLHSINGPRVIFALD